MMNTKKEPAMMKCTLTLILGLALPLSAKAACPQCACTVSATGMSFGRYNPLAPSSTDDTGDIRISCGGGAGSVAYTIQLSPGIYSSGFRPRRMGNGNSRLAYNLYTNAAHTIVWGDGSGGTGIVSGLLDVSGAGASREHIVYGRIPTGQTAAGVGSYNDVVMFTIVYQ